MLNEHVLADGTVVFVRPIRPEDAALIREGFERLSPESRYRRFFGAVTHLNDELLEYLTNVDGVSHVAFVAGQVTLDLKAERGLGVARFVRLPNEPDVAEAAVTVVDDMQGKGIGRILLTTLAAAARERGVKRFRGEVLATNQPIRQILADVAAKVVRADGVTAEYDVELDPPASHGPEPSALARLFREAAGSMAIRIRRLGPPAPRDRPAA
jgi:GNAT superfamily N-acetyltransferase